MAKRVDDHVHFRSTLAFGAVVAGARSASRVEPGVRLQPQCAHERRCWPMAMRNRSSAPFALRRPPAQTRHLRAGRRVGRAPSGFRLRSRPRKDIEITARDAEIHAKTLHIEKLKMQLAVLRRARFGRSSEKLDHEIEQLELLIGELEEEQAEEKARAGVTDPELDDPADDQPSATSGPGPISAARSSLRTCARDRHPRTRLHLPRLRRHDLQPCRPGRA